MPVDTPTDIKQILRNEYDELSFALNNFEDIDDNNNDD
jgi:hypothetical protein